MGTDKVSDEFQKRNGERRVFRLEEIWFGAEELKGDVLPNGLCIISVR